MSYWPFRFVHAADFHLEMPPFGLMEIPDHLEELFLEAAFASAQRVFDTALAEEVDFLILSGDLLRCRHTGPRGPLFLLEQFERLAERGTAVYWAGGRVDPPDSWPPSIQLPRNVHYFAPGTPEEVIHRREDTALARIVGASRAHRGRFRPSDFSPEEPGLFTIGVTNGTAELADLQASRIDYWALGGDQPRETISAELPMVHYPGSPQGRQPEETGPHGCTLVDIDRVRNLRATLVPTDLIRWFTERVEVTAEMERNSLTTLLRKKMESRIESTSGTDLFLSWKITGEGPLLQEIRRGRLGHDLLDLLRKEYGHTGPAAWSVSLEAVPQARFPAHWYEQDTIRGEFLRDVNRLMEKVDDPLGWESRLDALPAEYTSVALSMIPDESARADILRETALLGVDLLSGEESPS